MFETGRCSVLEEIKRRTQELLQDDSESAHAAVVIESSAATERFAEDISTEWHRNGAPAANRISSQLHRRAVRLEWSTVSWNVIEAGVAITAGILTSSTALIAFGSDSSIEVGSAVVLLWRLKHAGPAAGPAKRGAVETRALYLVAGTLFALTAYGEVDSVWSLLSEEGPHGSLVGIALAAVSLIVMPVLGFTKHRTGTPMGSKALQADAIETWVCADLSLALLVGLGLSGAFGLRWADIVGPLAMLPTILWQGIDALGSALLCVTHSSSANGISYQIKSGH